MMAKSPAVAMAYDAAIKQALSDHVDHELGPGWRDEFGDIKVLVQALADGATRELMRAGWEFNPGVAWPGAVAPPGRCRRACWCLGVCRASARRPLRSPSRPYRYALLQPRRLAT